MTPILIGLFVGAGIVVGWHVTSWVNRLMDWMERRR